MILLCIKHSDNPKAESRQFLCEVLQKHCGISNALDIITCTEFGKPVVEGAVFSVSHSGNLLCVAVQCENIVDSECRYMMYEIKTDAIANSIGVDIECISGKTVDRCQKIAKAKFFDCEQTVLQSSLDYVDTFCKMWTMKESYCKYTGIGLPDAMSFDTVSIHDDICLVTDIIDYNGKQYALSLCYNAQKEI